MSIRLRFTLLYNTILVVTLAIFGIALYSIQAGVTYHALEMDVIHSSETVGASVLQQVTDPASANSLPANSPPAHDPPPPVPFQTFSMDQAFRSLPEREIVRVLDASGNLVASPFGSITDALPLSAQGLAALKNQKEWWETATGNGDRWLIFCRWPVRWANAIIP